MNTRNITGGCQELQWDGHPKLSILMAPTKPEGLPQRDTLATMGVRCENCGELIEEIIDSDPSGSDDPPIYDLLRPSSCVTT